MNALDQRITVFVGKLADAAPPAIEFEVLTGVHAAPTRAHDRRPLLSAAVVLLVALGVVAVSQVGRLELRSDRPTFDAAPVAVSGLPFAVVPSSLPDGWRYVDLFDSGAGDPTEPSSSYLYRDPDTGAAVYVETSPPFDEPDPGPFRNLRDSFDATGAATFAIDGSFVWMRIAGVGIDDAVSLAEALTLDDVGSDRVPVLPPDSGFELDASRSIEDAPTTAGSVAQLRLRTPNGTADLVLTASDPDNLPANRFGVPTRIGDRTVYVSDHSVTRDPIDGRITAALLISNPEDVESAARVVASLEGAPLEAWDSIDDRIADDLLPLPVTDRIEIRDVTVTRHDDGALAAICATWRGTTRCRSDESPIWGGRPGRSVNLVVDGLWVIAGTIDAPSLERYEVFPAGAVVGATARGDDYVVFAYVVQTGDQVNVEYKSERTSGGFGFSRPAR